MERYQVALFIQKTTPTIEVLQKYQDFSKFKKKQLTKAETGVDTANPNYKPKGIQTC
jgi:hypothetical protein